MAVCNKKHVRKVGNNLVKTPCYYNAGVCVVDPIHQGGLEMFLRTTYPFHHGLTYASSKQPKQTMIPNNIVFANSNI